MTTDDFEKRIQRQPLRAVPTEWRKEILSAARQASRPGHILERAQDIPKERSLLSAVHSVLSGLLWPCPQAWAVLAAVWLFIAISSLTTHGPPRLAARSASLPPAQVVMALMEEKRLLAELLGPSVERLAPTEAPVAEPPKALPPRPRSEGRNAFSLA